MPLTLSYLIPMARLITDQTTKKRTFVDTFTAISIPKDQTHSIEVFVVAGTLDGIDAGSAKIDVTLYDPLGLPVSTQSVEGRDLIPGSVDFSMNFVVDFNQFGPYTFVVSYNGTPVPNALKYSISVFKST